MRKYKKLLALLLTVVMTAGLIGCGGGNGTTDSEPQATPADTGKQTVDSTPGVASEPVRNLHGMEIIVSRWWDPPSFINNLRQEEWNEYLEEIFTKHNFTWTDINLTGWGAYLELFTTSTMAQDPAADLYIMSPAWATQLMNQGMLLPLNTLESIDVFSSKFNQAVIEAFTKDGNVYALPTDAFAEPREFLFFNKRLFAEAGIDPNEPYELQARGEWTWDKFMEYCAKLTRDLDNDGIIDVYGFTGSDQAIINGIVASNMAEFIKRDADGKYYNGMTDPAFIEAINFGKEIRQRGYWAVAPEGAEWDWGLTTAFIDGHAAMCLYGAYRSEQYGLNMDDDFGLLFFPKGPKATDYNAFFYENVYVLPFNLDPNEAEDIVFALNLMTEPLEMDLTYPDYWKDMHFGYPRFRDAQSVDNTLALFHGGRMTWLNNDSVPGIDWGHYFWDSLGVFGDEETAQERIEAFAPIVEAAIAEANKNR